MTIPASQCSSKRSPLSLSLYRGFNCSNHLTSPVPPFPRGVRGDQLSDRLYLEVLIAARENHQ
ncbi:MAG: hypothetical protein WBA93_34720 [Microcoleaceae cyanobacterium]